MRIVLSLFEPELDTNLATARSFGGEPTEPARPDFKVLESSGALNFSEKGKGSWMAESVPFLLNAWAPYQAALRGNLGRIDPKGSLVRLETPLWGFNGSFQWS